MKSLLMTALLVLFSAVVMAQSTSSVFVQNSGSGETVCAPANGFSYSHHTNYAVQIRSLTVKWRLSTLLNEPVVDGVYKWEAGEGTPADYLDYRDCVLLECSPVPSTGYMVYIRLWPTVPKAGAGYGFNTPGSPSWENLFCTRSGENMAAEIPAFTAQTAREIWKNGFYVTGVVLNRIGGNDGVLQSGANSNDGIREELEPLKALQEQRQAKVKAMENPFTLAVNDNDTLTRDRIRLFTRLDPFFDDAGFLFTTTNLTTNNVSTINSLKEDIQLYEGWNKVYYTIFSKGFTLRGHIKVFYKKTGTGGVLLSDNFNNGGPGDQWIRKGYNSEYTGVTVTDGHLLIRQGGEHTRTCLLTKELHADIQKELILEFKSTVLRSGACRKAWIGINGHSVICRKQYNVAEAVKLVWNMQKGSVQCYIDGELYTTGEGDYFRSADGIVQLRFDCDDFERWEIDDVTICQ